MAQARSTLFLATGFASFTGAAVLNLLGLAGLADAVLEWRCFLNLPQLVASYLALKAFLFQFLPVHFPGVVQDYLIITGSFSIMVAIYARLAEQKSIQQILDDAGGRRHVAFSVALFLAPWVVLVWLAVRQVLWRVQYPRVANILSTDAAERSRLERLKSREDQKARMLVATTVGYPLVCLGLLFVFTDVAYTLTGATEIGGISFAGHCEVQGETLRWSP